MCRPICHDQEKIKNAKIKEKVCTVPLNHCNGEVIEKTFHILPTQVEGDKFDVVFDIAMEGHASMNLFKLSFFAK